MSGYEAEKYKKTSERSVEDDDYTSMHVTHPMSLAVSVNFMSQ